MLENKIEHIKTAANACKAKPGLNIRIKLVPNGGNTRQPQLTAENLDTTPSSAAHHLTRSAYKEEINGHNQTAVTEAYRLFEGPGSRFITSG